MDQFRFPIGRPDIPIKERPIQLNLPLTEPPSRNRPTLEQLLQRATGGLRLDRRTVFRPSMTYQVLHDPFWVWCEYHAPRSEAVDETTRYQKLLMQQGVEFEHAWIQKHYPDAVTIEPPFGLEALRNTLQAMLAGTRVIAQPQLWDLSGESYGKADLMIRDESTSSDLGSYHYRLIEIKRSKSLRDYHVMQAALYNRMVGRIQGHVPEEITVALKSGEEQVGKIHRQLESMLRELRLIQDVMMVCGGVSGSVHSDFDDEVEHVLRRCGSDRTRRVRG